MNEKIGEKLQSLGNNVFPYMQPAKFSVKKYLLKSLQSLGISPKSWVVTICGRVIYVLLSRVICVCFPMQSPRQGKKETVYNFLFFGDTCLVCSYVCTDACVEVNPGGLPPTLSPYSLRCSLPEPGADFLDWLTKELCDPLVSTPAAPGLLCPA